VLDGEAIGGTRAEGVGVCVALDDWTFGVGFLGDEGREGYVLDIGDSVMHSLSAGWV